MTDINGKVSWQQSFEKRTLWVILIAAVTMLAEIAYGYWTQSMALLADGWHMASHVLALGLTWVAYVITRRLQNRKNLRFSREKVLALAGFTSAVALQIVALLMAVESGHRLLHPTGIRFDQAIVVALIGLVVNGLSAWFLHHGHAHHDPNIRSAYLHVLADGVTSVAAIIALLAGKYFGLHWLDSISGILSAFIITRWAIGLMKQAGKELIDFERIT